MDFHIVSDEERDEEEYESFALNGHDNADSQHYGITTKIPPAFDGKTSWFQYEELIDDWVDLTTLATDKHGPALKNRLTGEAAVYKKLLDRDILKTDQGVKHFKDTLRPNFVRGCTKRLSLEILPTDATTPR